MASNTSSENDQLTESKPYYVSITVFLRLR